MKTTVQNTTATILRDALPALDRDILTREISALSRRLDQIEGSLLERTFALLDDTAAFRQRLYHAFQELNRTAPTIRDTEEKIERYLEFLAIFTPEKTLKGDRRAFHRWMDLTAVRERARVAMHASDRDAEMLLHLLRVLLIAELKSSNPESLSRQLETSEISRKLHVEFDDSPRWQNRVTVLKIWEGVLRETPPEHREKLCPPVWTQKMTDIMSAPEENVWVQVQAFNTMAVLQPEQCLAMIHHRFVNPSDLPDDVFLRTSLINILDESFSVSDRNPVIRDVFRRPDPSEHVRIQAALQLSRLPVSDGLEVIRRLNNAPDERLDTEKVLAASGIALGELIEKTAHRDTEGPVFNDLLQLHRHILDTTTSCRVQQALIEGLCLLASRNARRHPADTIDPVDFKVLQILDRIISDSRFFPRVRRLASEHREQIILNRDPDARDLMDTIRYYRNEIPAGGYFTVPAGRIPGDVLLGRVLAWASVNDYGYYAQPGRNDWKIWRGEQYRRRIWRIIHEISHPDPAKRQGFVHTVGRAYPGPIRAHARYLAETTETKVPGERLFIQDEYSWRPYLPTVDDVLSLGNSHFAGKPIKIYSCEGVFTLRSSKALQDRIMLWWETSLNYRSLVSRRNVDLAEIRSGHERSFTQVLAEDLNLEVGFEPHRYEYQGKLYQVIDPDLALHLYPAVKNQMDWRPLT